MVDGNIDPKTVEAMRTFRVEAENANEVFRKLERHMNKFTRKMNMANVHTMDFQKNLRDIQRMKLDVPDHKTSKQGEKRKTKAPPERDEKPKSKQEAPVTRVEIGTIRIDVSGVTDKTDKQKLAEDISTKVARELKSKMGGQLSNGGYYRGM